ncbi:VOC family protein [uncultured Phenylobacterium sp.]|uniref:VOC family protein n=1 Tax=uncultured Phenylobacterium sp. TaxID=349273 RepID=UPI0025F90A74|nr:VOC family protein [uncultured Phenylobacterium sp.]
MPNQVIARGLSHVALVCSDMYETVKFWEELGIPLVKMEELPGGGQHSFHDMGNGAMLSYMSFDGAPPAQPGIASQHLDVRKDGAKTAIASMNHVAMDLPADRFDDVLATLKEKSIGVVTINHGSDAPFAKTPDEKTWIRSMYFRDPDGIAFEFASLMRELGTEEDLAPRAKNAKGERPDYTPVLLRKRPAHATE